MVGGPPGESSSQWTRLVEYAVVLGGDVRVAILVVFAPLFHAAIRFDQTRQSAESVGSARACRHTSTLERLYKLAASRQRQRYSAMFLLQAIAADQPVRALH
jgi:hypothetical protein